MPYTTVDAARVPGPIVVMGALDAPTHSVTAQRGDRRDVVLAG